MYLSRTGEEGISLVSTHSETKGRKASKQREEIKEDYLSKDLLYRDLLFSQLKRFLVCEGFCLSPGRLHCKKGLQDHVRVGTFYRAVSN